MKYRIEKILGINADTYKVAKLIEVLISIDQNVKSIRFMNTFDTTSIVVGTTIIDYHDPEQRKWINRYLAYEPNEKELEKILNK